VEHTQERCGSGGSGGVTTSPLSSGGQHVRASEGAPHARSRNRAIGVECRALVERPEWSAVSGGGVLGKVALAVACAGMVNRWLLCGCVGVSGASMSMWGLRIRVWR
jgi:hypothetical protein